MAEKLRAIVIEDHPGQGFVFKMAVEQAGFDVELIQHGEFAKNRLAQRTADVIFLDLHLPGTSGEELLAQIKGDSRFAHTRIVLTTADEALAETLRDNVNLVLLKPIGYEQLRGLAQKVMRMRGESDL